MIGYERSYVKERSVFPEVIINDCCGTVSDISLAAADGHPTCNVYTFVESKVFGTWSLAWTLKV